MEKRYAGRSIRQFPNLDEKKNRNQKMGLNPEHITSSFTETVNGELLRVIRERLAPRHVQAVDAVPTEDSEGDPVFVITIVLSSGEALPDRSKMLGLVRHIRPVLLRTDEVRLPLLSFVSAEEMNRTERETA